MIKNTGGAVLLNKSYEALMRQLHSWLHRKTINVSVRRVSNLPVALATDIGIVRDENQDRIAVMKYRPRESDVDVIVIALADGMGGMVGGANAASLTISSFFSNIIKHSHLPLQEALEESIKIANQSVYELYSGSGGSTLSVIVIDSSENVIGINVGDSRIYEIFNGKTLQLSEDDTIAALAQKFNNNEELKIDARFSNELVQFMGQETPLVPHFISIKKEANKKILLTSDGAHNIGLDNINRLALNAINSGVLSRRIVELANWFGGHDNASVAILDIFNLPFKIDNNEGNVINVWDPFGELQIIDIHSPITETNHRTNYSEDFVSLVKKRITPENIKDKETIQENEIKEKKIRSRARKKNKISTNSNVAKKEIDQLDISFENKEGEEK